MYERRNSMKFRTIAGTLIFSLASVCAASAQDAQPATPAADKPAEPAAIAPKPAEKLVVKEGTDVNLKFAQDLSSKTVTEDDPVNLLLTDDLKVGDVIVAKVGAKSVGTITHAKKAAILGKAAELNIRLQYLMVGDTRMKWR